MRKLEDPSIYRAILENLRTGVYVVDEDRRIAFWNDDSGHLEKLGAELEKIMNCVEITWWGNHLPIKISLGSAEVNTGDNSESLQQRAEQSLEPSLTP